MYNANGTDVFMDIDVCVFFLMLVYICIYVCMYVCVCIVWLVD